MSKGSRDRTKDREIFYKKFDDIKFERCPIKDCGGLILNNKCGKCAK